MNIAGPTSRIVASYVASARMHQRTALEPSQIAGIITSVGAELSRLASGKPQEPDPDQLIPKVSIKASIKPDYLVCFDDGRRFKLLRRHLRALGMSPEQYRMKWGLPDDYPMVPPNYSKTRSELAKQMGLGSGGRGSLPGSRN